MAMKTKLDVKGYGRKRDMEKNQEESKQMEKDITGKDQGNTKGQKYVALPRDKTWTI